MHTSALIQLPAEPVPRDEVSKALSLKPVQFPSHLWLKQAVFGTIHLFPITFPYLPSLDPCQPSGRQLLQQSLGCCCTMISALQSPIIYFKPRGWTSLKKKKNEPDWGWEQLLPWGNVSPVSSHSTLLTMTDCQFGLSLYMATDPWNCQNFNIGGAQVEQSC